MPDFDPASMHRLANYVAIHRGLRVEPAMTALMLARNGNAI
jgi:hypothetical protein